jgi:enediyne biosynthesis protein E4
MANGTEVFFHLLADQPAEATEVRIDGRLVEPMYIESQDTGALYSLPAGAQCPLTVSIRAPGTRYDSDCRVVELRPAQFKDVSIASQVLVHHEGIDDEAEEFPVSTGIALGDYDNDGDLDLAVTNFGLPSQLFRNDGRRSDGSFEFVEVSQEAGVDGVFRGGGVTFVDYDNDGDADLYIGRDGVDVMFRNRLMEDGTARFQDVTSALGLDVAPAGDADPRQRTVGVVFGDYDGDGRLDLYLSTHISNLHDSPHMHQDRLYWNGGDRFVEVTNLLGGGQEATHVASLAALWHDIDGDGDADLVVSADHDPFAVGNLARPGVLWLNEGPRHAGADGRQWRFKDVSEHSGFAIYPDAKGQGLNAMGIAVGDVNGDGRAEIAMSNIGPNVLLSVTGNDADSLRISDIAARAGVQRTYLPWEPTVLLTGSLRRQAWHDMSITWGTHLLDADNDGDIDLFYAGGSPPAAMFGHRPVPNALFLNDGTGVFTERTNESGLADPQAGMGTARGDLDGDGWIDLIVANYRGPLRIYLNRGGALWPDRKALSVRLSSPQRNRNAIGAVVTLRTSGGSDQVCHHQQRPGVAGGSQVDCHFGLGNATPESLSVRWPNGEKSVLSELPTSGHLSCLQQPQQASSR